jgi:hypothetical protein
VFTDEGAAAKMLRKGIAGMEGQAEGTCDPSA